MSENPSNNPDTQTEAQHKSFRTERYHAEVSRIVAALRERSVGTLAAYSELAAIMGVNPENGIPSFDPQEDTGYGIVKRARKILQKEYGQHWQPIRDQGLLRFNNEQSLETGEKDIKGIRLKAHRSRKKIEQVVNYGELDSNGKVNYNFLLSVTGCLRSALVPKKIKELKAKVQNAISQIEGGQSYLVAFDQYEYKKPERPRPSNI